MKPNMIRVVFLVCFLALVMFAVLKIFTSKSQGIGDGIVKLAQIELESSFDPVIDNFNRIAAAENQERIINCSNIHLITILSELGKGISKQGYLGDYNGIKVVVKMTTKEQKEVVDCMAKVDGRYAESIMSKRCNGFPHMKMMKEILLHHELMHPNMARLLGYCVRSDELDALDLEEHGVISVFEYGEKVSKGNLTARTWTEKIRFAVGLAAFVRYLQNSPLGSLLYKDLTFSHMALVGPDIKITDLSSIINSERQCYTEKDCRYGIQCLQGQCTGYNAKYNLEMFYKEFFADVIMPGPVPDKIKIQLYKLNEKLKSFNITADELVKELLKFR